MVNNPKFYGTIICLLAAMNLNAASLTSIRSGSWYDPTIWDKGAIPTKKDKATIAFGTTVAVFGPYTDCDSLTINGFLDVGPTNLTIGGRDLQIDVRAIRNTECLINGRLRINGNWATQFKVYGNVKFNPGSTFEMLAGAMMIDGCAFTEALSVPAHKPLLDVTGATNFVASGGVITMFNPHYHPTGITIKGAKRFHSISFGNNLTLANFACRSTSDFILSETDKPTFNNIRLAYLPHPNRQNRVILNDITMTGNLEMTSGLVTGTGRIKIAGNILIGTNGKIETDIECNHTWQQNIATYMSNTWAVIKGNVYINNPNRILLGLNLEIQNGTLHLIQGKVDLNEKTLKLHRAPEGGSATAYVVSTTWSQTTGLLLIKNTTGMTIFPIGTDNSYLPVTVTGTGDFGVAAKPKSDYNPLGINVQWTINRYYNSSIGGVQVQWNAHNEGFRLQNNRANAQLCGFQDGLQNNIWQPISNLGVTSQLNGLVFTKKVENVLWYRTFTIQSNVPSGLRTSEAQNLKLVEYQTPERLSDKDALVDTLVSGNISIYPNPISNEAFVNLHLHIDNQSDTQIIVYNTNQQLVYQETFQANNDLKIPVADLPTGLYSVQIQHGGKQFYQKFVKN